MAINGKNTTTMSLNYQCPHCNGYLAINDCVIFSVQTSDLKSGIISLHSELGNYSIKKNPDFEISTGDHLDFYCPICHAALASEIHANLAKVIMIDEENREFEILFSRVLGEKTTFKIVGETMEIFGDDSAEYLDFINLTFVH
jgi:protein-disulfide isomerase